MSGAGFDSIVAAIEGAEEVRDAFEDLVQRADSDPGAPFAAEMLEQLAALKKDDRAAFERLRTKLKAAGCRVGELDTAMARELGEGDGRSATQADKLVQISQEAELFHAPDGTGYVDLTVNGHRETWSIRSAGFTEWLTRRYYETFNGAPNTEALQAARSVLQARARYDAPERKVQVRVAGQGDHLYLDLGDENWRAVEIAPTGWRVIDNPPVRFRRAAGMLPLPEPLHGGSVEALRKFLNVKTDADFVTVVAWTLAVLRNRGPYPILVLSGEQGSAKSTFASILRALLDPNVAPLRALPREDRDLFIAATNSHVLVFDNVSGLSPWISDTLCRLATGGGFAVRQLYSDQDEVLFDAARPAILNGIEDIVTRPDLADRALFLTLDAIPDERRRSEAELWKAFEAERAHIMGALLDAVVAGLKNLQVTSLPRLPRMADFALWATACETALWPPGTFWTAYTGNRDDAVNQVIDADPVAAAVRRFMEARTEWNGTASEFLGALAYQEGERVARSKSWPSSPQALSGRLRRAATFLRGAGIAMELGQRSGHARTRTIRITSRSASPMSAVRSETSSASSAVAEKSSSLNAFAPVEPTRAAFEDEATACLNFGADTPDRKLQQDADDADDDFPPF